MIRTIQMGVGRDRLLALWRSDRTGPPTSSTRCSGRESSCGRSAARAADAPRGGAGSGRLHLPVLGLEVEDVRRLGDREAVVLFHQAGDELFEIRDARPELGVLGCDAVGNPEVAVEVADKRLGHG